MSICVSRFGLWGQSAERRFHKTREMFNGFCQDFNKPLPKIKRVGCILELCPAVPRVTFQATFESLLPEGKKSL